jgi:uncharacterized protein DUF3592
MAAYPIRAAFAGVLLFVIGLGIAGGAWRTNAEEQERLKGWRRADGTVVELLKRRSPDGEIPMPVIAFTTASGERVSFTAATDRSSPYYVAAPVKVLYHPDHPQDALIDTSARRWTRNTLAAAAALILLGLGGYVSWYASRWDGTQSPERP